MDQIKQLLELFRYERFVYMFVTMVSLVVLVLCALDLIFKNTGTGGWNTIPEVIGLFGSTGGIGYTTGRLLKMWSDAIKILQDKQVADADL